MNTRIGACLLLGAAASFMCGCAGPGVAGDDYELVANPPGLKFMTPTITKKEFDRAFYERYQWTYRPGGWPAADLTFQRLKDIYRGSRQFIRSKTLPERIEAYFPTRDITLGTKGTTKNVLGELEYQHFGVDEIAVCIMIEQGMSRFSDQVTMRHGADPLGDMIVRGWYCAKASEPRIQPRFREFIDSIGIHGYAVSES